MYIDSSAVAKPYTAAEAEILLPVRMVSICIFFLIFFKNPKYPILLSDL